MVVEAGSIGQMVEQSAWSRDEYVYPFAQPVRLRLAIRTTHHQPVSLWILRGLNKISQNAIDLQGQLSCGGDNDSSRALLPRKLHPRKNFDNRNEKGKGLCIKQDQYETAAQ